MTDNSEEQITNGDKHASPNNMARTLLGPVAVKTIPYNDNHGKNVGGHRQELCVVALEPERRDNGGRKVSKGVERVGHEEILDGKDPEERVGDRLPGHGAVPVLVVHGGCVGPQALDGKRSLLRGQPGRGLGIVG